MSIQGSLEDVGVAEVLQFVHLGSSTGTLVLTRADERVEIGFHEGGIINAWDSRSLRLGELLVARGLVSREVVECALAMQATKPDPAPSIGDILISEGFVEPQDLRATVVEQIRQAVTRAIEWTHGSFVFVKGAPRRRDQFDPDAVLAYKLNTQALLLDIARALDHARGGLDADPAEWLPAGVADEQGEATAAAARRAILAAAPAVLGVHTAGDPAELELPTPNAVPPPPALPWPGPSAVVAPSGNGASHGEAGRPSGVDAFESSGSAEALGPGEGLRFDGEVDSPPLVRVISDDPNFGESFLGGLECETEILPYREVAQLSKRPASVIVVDMRPDRPLGDLAAVTAAASGVEPVVVLPDVTQAASVYALGARAVIPDQPNALSGYITAMLAAERSAAAGGRKDEPPESHGFARLREIFAGLRDSAPSATRILSLMRVVSDFAQRAAVFVLTGDTARVIGAFGRTAKGAPLADVLRKMGAVTLDGALREAAERKTVITKSYDPALLPKALASALGPPANGSFQIVPVVGGDKVILLVYLDNEERMRAVDGLAVIELAGAHIGLMFENDLLKRRYGVVGRERREAKLSSGSA